MVVLLALAGCGGGGSRVSAADVAQASNATSCDESGYDVESKLTGAKEAIYDCRFLGALPKCVTYNEGIANDATSEVQLLFANALNSARPGCLTERATIQARRRAAQQRAKQQAYAAAVRRDARAAWHQGYTPYEAGVGRYQLPNVYYEFLAPSSYGCADYVTDGCWKVRIVSRSGCPSGVYLEVGEYRDATQVGTAYGDSGALQARIAAVVEIDADASDVTGRVASFTCN